MSMLSRLTQRFRELRSYFVDNIPVNSPLMNMIFGSGVRTKAGQYVDEPKAFKLAAFFSAVSLLASSVASIPLSIKRKVVYDGEEDKPGHYANDLLEVCPNPLFTSYTMKEWLIYRAIVKGNAYLQKDYGGTEGGLSKRVMALWSLEPENVNPVIIDGRKKYIYTYRVFSTPEDKVGVEKNETYDCDDIIHIPGFMYDGMKGYGILDFARESIGMGLAVDEFGARFFSGDGMATGVITHPGRLHKPAKINIKESFKEQAQGTETASGSGGRGVFVLDEGMTFNKTGITPDEGQFLGTKSFTVEEVCRWLHIPLFMMAVGTTASSLSAEEQYNFFVNFGLKPWLDRITAELNVKLLNSTDRKEFEASFNLDALTLMTKDKLIDNFSKQRNMGLFTLNQISRKMGIPLFKGGAGDQRVKPSTMSILGGTDPTTPIPIEVLTGLTEILKNERNVTEDSAMAMAKLLMPTADAAVVKKMITPFLDPRNAIQPPAVKPAPGVAA